jgi:hypothetical protein
VITGQRRPSIFSWRNGISIAGLVRNGREEMAATMVARKNLAI